MGRAEGERKMEREGETWRMRGERDASGASSANHSYKVKAGAFGIPPQSLTCMRVVARPIKMWIKCKVPDRGVCHRMAEREGEREVRLLWPSNIFSSLRFDRPELK